MNIKEILALGRPSVSFEVFPPKKDAPFAPVASAVERLCAAKPSFMSVTYGAAGSANANTLAVARHVQECGIPALAHLTCLTSPPERIEGELDALAGAGIRNILALRGDPPASGPIPQGCFAHASDLVAVIRKRGLFAIGGACYPECHPECAHISDDIANLKVKVDAGLDFLTTQMFFDNGVYFHYLSRLRSAGITIPVIAGIMPVTNGRQIKRICQLSGTYLPPRFRSIVDRFGDSPAAMLDAGVAYATEQIIDLFANGADAVHVYTMNRPETGERIMRNLESILAG
ncbi:MAG: methylenetetrahydrofolate reductase [Kiritimatiellae bacterium]|nr:methylenetetrahydrofolate reductase [Kiritimatiellia bacterium]